MADIHNSQQCDHDLGAPLLCPMSNNPPSVSLLAVERGRGGRKGRAGIWSAFVKLHREKVLYVSPVMQMDKLKQSLR